MSFLKDYLRKTTEKIEDRPENWCGTTPPVGPKAGKRRGAQQRKPYDFLLGPVSNQAETEEDSKNKLT